MGIDHLKDKQSDEVIDEPSRYEAVCHIVDNNILRGHQAISTEIPNEIYNAGVGDSRYRFKLKEKLKRHDGSSIIFAEIEHNKPSIVISDEASRVGRSMTELTCCSYTQRTHNSIC